jgi:polyhydroxyalkanoate synthesis repressor PhaR
VSQPVPERKPPARIIKRYANRKLYDTRESRYVTLLDIAKLIREGEELRIIDNKSKDDVTNVTFAQIIYEEEKTGDGETDSAGLLREFIRSGTDKLLTSFRDSPVGRLVQRADQERLDALQSLTTATERAEAAGRKALETIASAPREAEAAGRRALDSLLAAPKGAIDELQRLADDGLRAVLSAAVARVQHLQAEVGRMQTRIDELETKLKDLQRRERE